MLPITASFGKLEKYVMTYIDLYYFYYLLQSLEVRTQHTVRKLKLVRKGRRWSQELVSASLAGAHTDKELRPFRSRGSHESRETQARKEAGKQWIFGGVPVPGRVGTNGPLAWRLSSTCDLLSCMMQRVDDQRDDFAKYDHGSPD